MDYVFFIYGFAFVLLAAICYPLARRSVSGLPWIWLGAFGILHGLNEWLDMLAISLGDSPSYKAIRIAIMAISFLPLLEFGRRGWKSLGGRAPGAWIFIPLLVFCGLGITDGMNGLGVSCRYVLAIPGALSAGLVLIKAAGLKKKGQRWQMLMSGASFFIYAVAAGLITPKASFYSASIINQDLFLSYFSFPIQLLRAACAVTAATGIWLELRQYLDYDKNEERLPPWLIPIMIIVLLVAGWRASELRGQKTDMEIRGRLLSQATSIAQTINPQRVWMPTDTAQAATDPQLQRVREQLISYGSSIGRKNIYSVALCNGVCVHGPENFEDNSTSASRIGSVYKNPPDALRSVFDRCAQTTIGPYAKDDRAVISAFAPVLDHRTGGVLLAIGADIPAEEWKSEISAQRLPPILFILTMIVVLLSGNCYLRWREDAKSDKLAYLLQPEAILTAVFGSILTAAVTLLAHDETIRTRGIVFSQVADGQAASTWEEIRNIRDDQLGRLSSLFEASEDVTRNEFNSFTRSMSSIATIRELQWIRYAPAADKERIENDIRHTDIKDFTIFQTDGNGNKIPASGRDAYYPVLYAESTNGNTSSLGLDLGAKASYRKTFEKAAQVGLPTAFVSENTNRISKNNTAMVCQPVFKNTGKQTSRTENGRNDKTLIGFTLVTVQMQAMLNQAVSRPNRAVPLTTVDLLQLKAGEPVELLATYPQHRELAPENAKIRAELEETPLRRIYPLFAFGRAYALVVNPTPAFISIYSTKAGFVMCMAGILITGIMTVFVGTMSNRRMILEREVKSRTLELSSSKERLQHLIADFPVGIYRNTLGENGEFVMANAAMANIFGYESIDEFLQRNVIEFYQNPDDRKLFTDRLLAEGFVTEYELNMKKRDGELIYGSVSARIVYDEQGNVLYTEGTLRDVTDRKHTEELRMREMVQRTILDNISAGVVIIDPETHIIEHINPAGMTMFGANTKDIVGRVCHTYFCPAQVGACPITDLGKKVDSAEREMLCSNGSSRAILKTVKRVNIGGREKLLESFVDITEGKRAQEDLKETNCRLEEAIKQAKEMAFHAEAANRAKSTFLTNMSHEIRTPMAAILGFAESLIDELQSPAERSDAIFAIQRNSDHLLQIINDILDLSKIEAGKLEIERINCSPIQMLSDIRSMMNARAKNKNLSLRIAFDGPLPERILSDSLRIKQILINLVGNAVKFTERGGICIITRLIGPEDGARLLQFEVSDTGIGLYPEQIARLFTPFNQVDNSTTRRFGGTGLGLAICKRLVEILGGTIGVESQPGKGSRFYFSINPGPLNNTKLLDLNNDNAIFENLDESRGQAASIKLDANLLLVEDGADNQRLIAGILRKAGATVATAENGRIALEKVKTSTEQGLYYDAILMDMQMPEIDGYEATRRLRAEGLKVPIIALTAHAMADDRQKCLGAGCDDYMTKPIDRKVLLLKIAELIERKQFTM